MKIKLLVFLAFISLTYSANAAVWYVNVNTGADSLDGSAPFYTLGLNGPKKTIANAFLFAAYSDTIYISEGLYEERLYLDKPIVLLGNNWGINPLTQTRNLETIIVPPFLATGFDVSGNSAIEIASCCVEINGIMIKGDNPNIINPPSKYNKEYEVGYGIGVQGAYTDLYFNNLIINNFVYAGIRLVSGSFPTLSNKIENSKISIGDQNSNAIILDENFYCDITFVTIDSVGKGVSFNNFSAKNSKNFNFSYLNITAETHGICLNNFSGSTDSIKFEYTILNPSDPAINFVGFSLVDLYSDGYSDISNIITNYAYTGFSIRNVSASYLLNLTNNAFNYGKIGVNVEQSTMTPNVNLNLISSNFNNLDSVSIMVLAEGGLLNLNLNDISISKSAQAIVLKGNANIALNATQFDQIYGYYLFLDSINGLKPTTKIDATTCFYEGILGANLNKDEGFMVENKIRHYMDKPNLAWVLFKDKNLFVGIEDGNDFVNRALNIASNTWNIYLDSTNSNENVIMDKTIHLYPHPAAAIGNLKMQSNNETLFLHGKLSLLNGLDLVKGMIVTTPADTLILYRSNANDLLSSGNILSYVNGTLYVKYINFPANYAIIDTIPIGLGKDFRPMYVNAIWPTGLIKADIGFKSYLGKAPIANLPANITHISDRRYWQITNPLNQSGFSFSNVGFAYNTTNGNDLVNDPANLRVVYQDASSSYNLGGSGTTPNIGTILSSTGSSIYGYYTAGNAVGGNNTLSPTNPIALLNVTGHCANDSIQFSASNSRSDSAIVSWEWAAQGPSTVLTPENSETIKKSITAAGIYQIALIITNKNGYKDTVGSSFTIDALPTLSYTSVSPCFPLPIDVKNTSTLPPFTSLAATEWKINANYFTTPNLNFTPTLSGIQIGYLKLTLNTGCSDTLPISVLSPIAPTITFIPNGIVDICAGDSAIIKVNKSAGTVVWSDGLTHDSLILKTVTFNKATIFSSPQCFSADSVRSTILALPTVNAGPDFTTLPGKIVNFNGASNSMVEWIPDTWLSDATIPKPTSRPLSSTTYILRAYTIYGCEATDTMSVTVNSENTTNIPNLLTPNADGHNDVWVLSNFPVGQKCSVHVFTREGQLVYESLSYNNNWNGKRDNMELPDGYYPFVIENKTTNKVYTGILNILK